MRNIQGHLFNVWFLFAAERDVQRNIAILVVAAVIAVTFLFAAERDVQRNHV